MRKIIIPLLAAAVCSTAGCANRVVFVTHSSVGLDVSGTAQLPNKVSFSFERYEAAIVPRKTNGEAHSVFGGMDADMTWFRGHTIKQTFATGEAARLAAGGTSDNPVNTTNRDTAPLIFLTATTYGLNLSAGEQSMSPNLLLGYRRTEASVIPVPDSAQEVRSVYADILINSATNTDSSVITTNFSALAGVRIKQSFATGKAADALAKTNKEVRENLAAAAGVVSISDFRKKAVVENQIGEKLSALSSDKQKQLFTWADKTFPQKGGGQLASQNAGFFQNSFLPDLDLEEHTVVLDKINQLEKETP
jgi:hypothetical protein